MTSPSVVMVSWKALYLTTGRHPCPRGRRFDACAQRRARPAGHARPVAPHAPASRFDARLPPAVPRDAV